MDAYGVIPLPVMVVGYFGLFDLGLGAAATKLIAEAEGTTELQQNQPVYDQFSQAWLCPDRLVATECTRK